jgi:hypothetical protein
MTIAITWVRKVQDYEQLVFVADSRISGGASFDGCPKITRFVRTDCAASFAGDAAHAFPMMMQLGLALESFPKLARGAHELSRVKKHALKVLNAMLPQIQTTIPNPPSWLTKANTEFIFGGYNWRRKCFQAWNLRCDSSGSFIAHPAKYWAYDLQQRRFSKNVTYPDPTRTDSFTIGPIAFAGDQAAVALELLEARMLDKFRRRTKEFYFDMEPFEVVRDMLRDPLRSSTIGGAPQVVKVFQYLRSAPFAVYWPNKQSGIPYLQGRPVRGYEALDKQAIDPDTLDEEAVVPSPQMESNLKD